MLQCVFVGIRTSARLTCARRRHARINRVRVRIRVRVRVRVRVSVRVRARVRV